MCAAKNGKVIGSLDLPAAGLMSLKDCEGVSGDIERMEEVFRDMCGKTFTCLCWSYSRCRCCPDLL